MSLRREHGDRGWKIVVVVTRLAARSALHAAPECEEQGECRCAENQASARLHTRFLHEGRKRSMDLCCTKSPRCANSSSVGMPKIS